MSDSKYRPRQHWRRRWDDGDVARRALFCAKAEARDLALDLADREEWAPVPVPVPTPDAATVRLDTPPMAYVNGRLIWL